MIKKVLILGSNSFTAGYMINKLLSYDKISIIGLSRNNQYIKALSPYKNTILKKNKFKFYKIDINKDLDLAFSIITKFKPTHVINYAAQGEVRNSWKFPIDWYQTNIISNIKIIEFLKNNFSLKKYISVSTPEVYGSNLNAISENKSYFPTTPYAISKLSTDLHLHALFSMNKFPVVFTRSSNVYGPYQQLYRIIPKTIINLRLGKKIILHGGGKSKRSFIHASDVADFTYKAMTIGKSGDIYHCSSEDKPISIKKIVKLICNKLNKNYSSSVIDIDENFGQDQCYFLNSNKAKKILSWVPKYTLDSGINSTINWVDSNWTILKKKNHEYKHQK